MNLKKKTTLQIREQIDNRVKCPVAVHLALKNFLCEIWNPYDALKLKKNKKFVRVKICFCGRKFSTNLTF